MVAMKLDFEGLKDITIARAGRHSWFMEESPEVKRLPGTCFVFFRSTARTWACSYFKGERMLHLFIASPIFADGF